MDIHEIITKIWQYFVSIDTLDLSIDIRILKIHTYIYVFHAQFPFKRNNVLHQDQEMFRFSNSFISYAAVCKYAFSGFLCQYC